MKTVVAERESGGWLPPGGPGRHPVAVCVAGLEQTLGGLGDGCCWGLSSKRTARRATPVGHR